MSLLGSLANRLGFSRRGAVLCLALLCAYLIGFALPAAAHDIPGKMRVHALVKYDDGHLRVLLRLPLALFLNVNLPKRGPGYIDLAQIDAAMPVAIKAIDQEVELFADGRRLPLAHATARISQPSDRSFDTFERALAHMRGAPLPESTNVFWNQGYVDAELDYGRVAKDAGLAIDFHPSPGLGDRLKLDLGLIRPDGQIRAFEIATGSGTIPLDPRWYQAAWSFVQSGFEHILDGPDHLLFLLCLVLPFRRIDWNLVGVITSFTLAHSITLIAAAYGFVPAGAWFPPTVEVLIAASILYMAIENVVHPALSRRWILSGAFGLVHGFAFSFLLTSQLQFAGTHLLLSLLSFNVGIELGQLLVLAVTVPLLGLLYSIPKIPERLVVVVGSVLIGHTAWHWVTERVAVLRKVEWPEEWLTSPGLAAAIIVVTLLSLLAWGARRWRRIPDPVGTDTGGSRA